MILRCVQYVICILAVLIENKKKFENCSIQCKVMRTIWIFFPRTYYRLYALRPSRWYPNSKLISYYIDFLPTNLDEQVRSENNNLLLQFAKNNAEMNSWQSPKGENQRISQLSQFKSWEFNLFLNEIVLILALLAIIYK